MPASDAANPALRFARLRDAFHRLVQIELSQRERAIEALASTDPEVAGELRDLLGRMDETDLLAAPQRAPPSRLGPFRLLHRIGRGGMGDVFLAERVDGGFVQRVALKLMRDTAVAPDLARRFVRERQILARLQHPNIAHLVDGGITPDGRPWLAMEYIDGERITAWCASRALDPQACVRLFLPICDAVQFAHRNLVVHRDLKPANLLVDADGRPRLLDFGIARLLDAGESEQTRTLAALTPAYAAPEQRAGGEITTATDVYQLGLVLRELVSGERADAASPAARRALHGDLGRVLDKATAIAPADRYAGVAAFADDLRDWLLRAPLRSGIGGRRRRLVNAMWQWRWPLAMLAVVVVSLGGGALLAWREARIAEARAQEARVRLEALLGVIGQANPGRYAGREPLVGELLVDAAAQLRKDFADDPRLLRETLGEIAHGLVNLGRRREAVPLLRAALAALQHDPQAGAASEIGLLKLLVLAQTSPDADGEVLAAARRLAALARDAGPERGAALDALASAAGALARVGDFASARTVLAEAERLDPDAAALTVSQRENYWRQVGWVALRSMDTAGAQRAFARSRREQDANTQQFSSLRRAELDLLQGEAALARGDAAAATAALQAAQPVFEVEYPAGHVERAWFELQRVRALLLHGHDVDALALALGARAVMQSAPHDPGGREFAERVARVALARNGRCREALADVDTSIASVPSSPRRDVEIAWAQREIAQACAAGR